VRNRGGFTVSQTYSAILEKLKFQEVPTTPDLGSLLYTDINRGSGIPFYTDTHTEKSEKL
jgi:hypothetical protein